LLLLATAIACSSSGSLHQKVAAVDVGVSQQTFTLATWVYCI